MSESVNCAICNQKNDKILAKRVRPGIDQYVVICKNDGLVYLNPRWNQEQYNKYYTEGYYKNDQLKPSAKKILIQEQRALKIISFTKQININKNSKILEVGCGAGHIIGKIQSELKCDAYAIEPGGNWNNYLRKFNLKVFNTDLSNFKSKEKFDLILLSHVFEHFLRLDIILEQLKNLLHDDGHIYLEVPNILDINPDAVLTKSFFRIPHTYYFSRKTLEMVLLKQGFDISKVIERDNCIKALVHKNNSSKENAEFGNDYKTIKNYLIYYSYLKYPFMKFITLIFSIISRFLSLIGIKDTLKRLLLK